MKGRTRCPHCSTEFIVEVEEGKEKAEAVCPTCGHRFIIKPCDTTEDDEDECTWEEYGEPRKTILSSKKPHTDKPILAAFLLIGVSIICLSAAAAPTYIVETPVAPLSFVGVKSSLLIHVSDERGMPQPNISIYIEGYSRVTNESGEAIINQLTPGIKIVSIQLPGNKVIKREVFIPPFIQSTCNISYMDPPYTPVNLVWCQTILIIFSILSILGAYASFNRRYPDLAMFGGVIGILSIGFFMINIILGALAILLIVSSKEEFEDGKKGKHF